MVCGKKQCPKCNKPTIHRTKICNCGYVYSMNRHKNIMKEIFNGLADSNIKLSIEEQNFISENKILGIYEIL